MGDHSSSASYIRTVHHLIEKCLLHNLSKEECMEALQKHANINPVITSTVWTELEKENKEFFDVYMRDRAGRALDQHAQECLQKLLSEAASRGPDHNDDDDNNNNENNISNTSSSSTTNNNADDD